MKFCFKTALELYDHDRKTLGERLAVEPICLLSACLNLPVYEYSHKRNMVKFSVDTSINMRHLYSFDFCYGEFNGEPVKMKFHLLNRKWIKVASVNSYGESVIVDHEVIEFTLVPKIGMIAERHFHNAVNIAISMFNEDRPTPESKLALIQDAKRMVSVSSPTIEEECRLLTDGHEIFEKDSAYYRHHYGKHA